MLDNILPENSKTVYTSGVCNNCIDTPQDSAAATAQPLSDSEKHLTPKQRRRRKRQRRKARQQAQKRQCITASNAQDFCLSPLMAALVADGLALAEVPGIGGGAQ